MTPLEPIVESIVEKVKSVFEANALDGDKVSAACTLNAEFAWEVLEEAMKAELTLALEAVYRVGREGLQNKNN